MTASDDSCKHVDWLLMLAVSDAVYPLDCRTRVMSLYSLSKIIGQAIAGASKTAQPNCTHRLHRKTGMISATIHFAGGAGLHY